MLDELTFGEFITVKRKQSKYTIKDLADKLSLSSTYLCNVEHGVRPAPSYDMLVRIARALELNNEDRLKMFDLAAKTKQRVKIPEDVVEYIEKDQNVCLFLRTAIERKLNGLQLLILINGK